MLKWILLFAISINLGALEVTLSGAQDNFQKFSSLHIKDDSKFLCQEIKNDFDVVTKVVCAFSTKPSREFRDIQNSFFKVTSQVKNKTFFIIVTPFEKQKLYPVIFNLAQDESIFEADVQLAKHWMLVGYKENLPIIKKNTESDFGIKFPFFLDKDKLPFVDGLDIKGNPVHIDKVQDVSDYLKIKKLYAEKKYEACIDLIETVIEEYPNTLFMSELVYYKILVYNKKDDYDNVIENSKLYLREYSADEHVADVLSLIAKSYSLIGLNVDADYFFDRLFSEHKDSEYANWGYIYKADMLEASGDAEKALSFYKKALQETGDIQIASTAAYKIAYYKTSFGSKEKAAKYIMKIVKAKPSFFIQDLKKSMEMMYMFADSSDFITAAAIAKSITDATDTNHDEYERLLRDRAVWLSKTDKKEEALQAINKYLQTYKYGNYEEEMQTARDSLFFDSKDQNFTAKLNEYNALIDEYKDDSIGSRALYEKAKLLLKHKHYSDLLGLKESILELNSETYPDTNQIIQDAAVGVMNISLKNKECHQVLTISSEYNVTISSEWDENLYDCAMKGADFLLAKKLAEKNLKSKNLDDRKKWLNRYIKVEFATGNYSDVIEASKELITLISDDTNSPYIDVYRTLFDTYQRLEDSNKMISTIMKLQEVYGLDYKDIERYIAVMAIGSERKDNNIVIKYGEEVVKIQKSSSSNVQSPFVEFTLYQAYVSIEDNYKALDIIKSLDEVKLTNNQRARQKYLLGSIYSKLWREGDATKAYDEAIKADPSSAWAKLAKDAKEIE